MSDLDDALRPLKRAPSPDLWPEIEARQPRPARPGAAQRALVAAAALLVTAAAFGFVARTFFGGDTPRPAQQARAGVIAFTVRGAGPEEVWVTAQDGSAPRRIVVGRDPAWSPDGSLLAYRSGTPGRGDSVIQVLDMGTGETREVARVAGVGDPGGGGPSWSPDGTALVFDTYAGLYRVNVDGTGLERITESPREPACYHLEPSWSPLGQYITYSIRCEGGDHGVFYMREDGSLPGVLLTGTPPDSGEYPPDSDVHPVWSPDGSRIAFVRREEQGSGPANVFVLSFDGGRPRQVTDQEEIFFPGPLSWSPDGSRIVVSDSEGDLYVVDVENGAITRLEDGGLDACCPSWEPAA